MSLTEIRVDARPIALARMCLGAAYLVCLGEVLLVLSGVAAGKLAYPVLEPLPDVSSGLVASLTLVGMLAGVLLILGILSSASAVVGCLVLVVAQLLDQQTYSNHLILCTLLLAYLAFAKSGSRWGVDARLRGRRDTVPWWPQLLMMSQVAICYLFAGLSKINPIFLSGQTLPEFLVIDAPPLVFRALAVATIATEIFLAVALWLPATRRLAVLVGLGLHVGIVVLFDGGWLTFIAFSLLCVATYWMFLMRPTLSGQSHVMAPRSGLPGRITVGDRG
ncbi:HTTM domain-containing protein [Ornithinimicrobium murale]|uniref:HTTM domain-containing protein n=1 Tax=Ornithinimicrobium murale TaxID=1050153 RepID=UPI000E0D628F|nr:HTTM domain-containing protein [Ornithinimicrobium murale]